VAHALSLAQVAGQVAPAPLQTYGAQVGCPALPVLAFAHWPFSVEPPDIAHVWHAPVHAVLQQYPSTHPPLPRHSAHGLDRQSVASSHVEPTTFSGTQSPDALQ
jgi:hypothetical protein